MKKMKKGLLVACALTLALSCVLCGCSKTESGGVGEMDLSSYPVKTDAQLTYWMDLPSNVSATSANFGDTPFAKELEKRTGVTIKYIHPALGQAQEAFGILVASDDMTDLIQYDWSSALGGPDTTINDQVILPLDDLIKEYAPSLSAYLAENPDVDKYIKTNDGQYYVFPFIRGDKMLRVTSGMVIRNDWLKELGLKEPTTLEEMENVLRAFKEKKGAKAPLSILSSNTFRLLEMCGSHHAFYLNNGKVEYGPYEPQFREALETMNRWFNEGLLDKNYVSTDSTMLDANVLNGDTGVTFCSGGSGLGKWLQTMEGKSESFDLKALPVLSYKDSGLPRFIAAENPFVPGSSVAITRSCKYPELAAKFLDYAYSEEGSIYYNFGQENVSYKWEGDYPKYTDLIMKNPDGLPVNQAMGLYLRGVNNGPFVQDKRYIEQYYERPQQRAALDAWTTGLTESEGTRLPTLLYTAEEGTERSGILSEVEKYRDEMMAAFISGVKSFDEYPAYLERLEKLGIKDAIAIEQAAYDRVKGK